MDPSEEKRVQAMALLLFRVESAKVSLLVVFEALR